MSPRPFDIDACLGEGGFGIVYRARMTTAGGLQSAVAVKLLKDPGEAAVRRLRREGELLASLHHPAVLKAIDLVELGGRMALVTEFVEGWDLAQIVEQGPVPPKAALQLAERVAEVLEAAYDAPGPGGGPLHLVHRDVKPSNIRVEPHGELKVLDFGIAWAAPLEQSTHGHTLVGSAPYMAPERFGRATAGPEGDVFGLGCVLVEALSGRRVHADTPLTTLVQRASDPEAHARWVESRCEELPPDLAPLCRSMLAHASGERPTAREVAERCAALAGAAEGPELRSWARSLDLPAATRTGPLTGRRLIEGGYGAVADAEPGITATLPLPAEAEPPVRPRGMLAVLPLGLLVVVAASAMLWGPTGSVQTPQPSPAESAAVTPSPVPLPAPTPTSESAPPEPSSAGPDPSAAPGPSGPHAATASDASTEPAPAGSSGSPGPRPTLPVPAPLTTPAPAPAPAPPAPVTVPTPVPVTASTTPVGSPEPAAPLEPVAEPVAGTLRVVGDVRSVELRGAAGAFGPGPVPAGRYDVFVDFQDHGFSDSLLDVTVRPDQVVAVRCNTVTWSCELR